MLFCSPKLQKELGLELPISSVSHSPRSLGDWYAELFWCERRKCLLFVSSSTYLSFVVLDVFRSEMRPLDVFFLRNLECYLKHQGLPSTIRDSIFDEYRNAKVFAAKNDQMVNIIDELVFHARFLIAHGNQASLRAVDSMEISRRLSDIPIPELDTLYPWRAARLALGLESKNSAHVEVTSHHPLARRVGSPILTVINGGIG